MTLRLRGTGRFQGIHLRLAGAGTADKVREPPQRPGWSCRKRWAKSARNPKNPDTRGDGEEAWKSDKQVPSGKREEEGSATGGQRQQGYRPAADRKVRWGVA